MKQTPNKNDRKMKIDYAAYLRSKKPEPLIYFLDELVIVNK